MAPKKATTLSTETDAKQPLFPKGYKYPASLLNERCNKLGWRNAAVNTRHTKDGYAFSVTLRNFNKKTSQIDSVILEPNPPHTHPTAIEAKHYGAVYALYRFSSHLQLHMQLPPGPREYWAELASERKAAPKNLAWMWHPDPFEARREFLEKQSATSTKAEDADYPSGRRKAVKENVSREFDHAPEIRMSSGMRDLIEGTVEKSLSSSGTDLSFPVWDSQQSSKLQNQLVTVGFTYKQVQQAINYLATPSALQQQLLASLQPLEACMEYLLLSLPEDELPARFLPANNSANPFIICGVSGSDDIAKRWLIERAVRAAGFPLTAVQEASEDGGITTEWETLLLRLDFRLAGFTAPARLQTAARSREDAEGEIEVVQAVFPGTVLDGEQLVIPVDGSPLKLCVCIFSQQTPMYISSPTVPSYIRLHLLSCILHRKPPNLEPFCLIAVDLLQEEWRRIQLCEVEPQVEDVMRNLRRNNPTEDGRTLAEQSRSNQPTSLHRTEHPHCRSRYDRRSDQEIRAQFQSMVDSASYRTLATAKNMLPAAKVRSHFLRALVVNRVLIVTGETGSGKTTQLPQYILDDAILSNKGSRTSIVVVQPRRLAATGVAARVSEERMNDGSVGFTIRGSSNASNKTKILFCTTGVLLRRLTNDSQLHGVSHVLVDEVHERSLDCDLLLLELKEILHRNETLKVILMSATINHESFVRYFDAPLLSIPGQMYPVKDMYLEDFVKTVDYQPKRSASAKATLDQTGRSLHSLKEEFEMQGQDNRSIERLLSIMTQVGTDSQLAVATVEMIIKQDTNGRGVILVFMPGIDTIMLCIEHLRKRAFPSTVQFLPLHANLSSSEQNRIFMPSDNWKVVVSTNVAETSITVDNVRFVVDSGRVKETRYDGVRGMQLLVETWVSSSSSMQRRGRAGRTGEGVCYKLYTRPTARNFDAFTKPEILRSAFENTYLNIKAMRPHEDVRAVLLKAIDVPDSSVISRADTLLRDLGAIDAVGNLTCLGHHMAALPMDVRLGKMLVFGCLFRCIAPVVTIVSILSSKPFFLSPKDRREESVLARNSFASSNSDLLTCCRAFDQLMQLHLDKAPRSIRSEFCDKNFLSLSAFEDIVSVRHETLLSLTDRGLLPASFNHKSRNFLTTTSLPTSEGKEDCNFNGENLNLVKSIVLAGFFPQVCRVVLPQAAVKFDRLVAGTVQRPNEAKDYRIYDESAAANSRRVFLHPSSILFGVAKWGSVQPFLTYFAKSETSKIFVKDVSEIPLYSLLMFGGILTVDHLKGGLTLQLSHDETVRALRFKAWPRIGVLVNQLRKLLDKQLEVALDTGQPLVQYGNVGLEAISKLLENDGL